jgi:hypothetical protein
LTGIELLDSNEQLQKQRTKRRVHMPAVEYAGQAVEVNDEGFLVDSNQWTPEIAEAIASEVGIGELTDTHWKVITFCREDAAQQGQPPGLRQWLFLLRLRLSLGFGPIDHSRRHKVDLPEFG